MTDTCKPKRRRRLATPPPEDAPAAMVDYYDESVCKTFNNLTSGNVDHPVESAAATTDSPSASSQTEGRRMASNEVINDPDLESVIDLCTVEGKPMLQQNRVGEITQNEETEEPPSPPRPVQAPSKLHTLGNGVRAAFDRLEKVRLDTEHAVVEDDIQQRSGHLSNQTPETSIQSPDQSVRSKIKIRVNQPDGINRYELNICDSLFRLREAIAKKESTEANRISLFYEDNAITEIDTAKSLGLTVADTVEAYVLAQSQVSALSSQPADMITVKVQGRGGQRDVIHIPLAPEDSMEILMKKFAEEKGVELSSLTFNFDGDEISAQDTPSSLSMEDGDCVDVLS